MLRKILNKETTNAEQQEDRFHGLKVNTHLLLSHDTRPYLLFNI